MTTPTITPSGTTPPKGRGCFFYGCIISLVFVFVIGTTFVLVMGHYIKLWNAKIAEYTDTQPMALPHEEMPAEELKALKDRLSAFSQALDAGSNAPPLVLTGRDLNGLLNDAFSSGTAQMKTFQNGLHVGVGGDRIEGQVSLRADKILRVPFIHTEGRYLNGAVAFKAMLTNQQLSVFIDALEVKGKPLPDELMSHLRQVNFTQGMQNNPSNAAAISRFETIQIKDGKIVITPKKPEAQ